ncbi:MAG: DUF6261 family protein [Capnocytophaga sp.]|nr:DUF6261 family protein [Capnocytophaga sp.]
MGNLKLTSIHLPKLHNAEFGQFITRFLEDFEKTNLSLDTDADFKVLYNSLKEKLPAYQKALEQIRANEESKHIADLDKVRDYDMQALRDSIKPYRNVKTEEKKKAYHTLKIVLDSYKNLRDEAYEKETAQINSLITTLKTGHYAEAARTLNITEFILELEKTNKEFNDVFAHRSYQALNKETYNAKDVRKEIVEVYRKMTNYIVTLADVKQDEFYKKVLEVINNSRKYYADVIARRSSKVKDEEKTSE